MLSKRQWLKEINRIDVINNAWYEIDGVQHAEYWTGEWNSRRHKEGGDEYEVDGDGFVHCYSYPHRSWTEHIPVIASFPFDAKFWVNDFLKKKIPCYKIRVFSIFNGEWREFTTQSSFGSFYPPKGFEPEIIDGNWGFVFEEAVLPIIPYPEVACLIPKKNVGNKTYLGIKC